MSPPPYRDFNTSAPSHCTFSEGYERHLSGTFHGEGELDLSHLYSLVLRHDPVGNLENFVYRILHGFLHQLGIDLDDTLG